MSPSERVISPIEHSDISDDYEESDCTKQTRFSAIKEEEEEEEESINFEFPQDWHPDGVNLMQCEGAVPVPLQGV
nr:unnamed protein product [Spirometra erinaceieuropaei]